MAKANDIINTIKVIGSQNLDPEIKTGCPEEAMAEAQSRSTVFYDTTQPPPENFGTASGLKITSPHTVQAQHFVNDLRDETGRFVKAANEAFKVHLRNNNSETATVLVEIYKKLQGPDYIGDILINEKGDIARWELEVFPNEYSYFEITVDRCLFFPKNDEFWFAVRGKNEGEIDVDWLFNPTDDFCDANIERLSTSNFVLEGNTPVTDIEYQYTSDCGTSYPFALRIDAEVIYDAPEQVDVNLDGRTGVTDLLMAGFNQVPGFGLTPQQIETADINNDDLIDYYDILDIRELILESSYQYLEPILKHDWKRPDINHNSLLNNHAIINPYYDENYYQDISYVTPNSIDRTMIDIRNKLDEIQTHPYYGDDIIPISLVGTEPFTTTQDYVSFYYYGKTG